MLKAKNSQFPKIFTLEGVFQNIWHFTSGWKAKRQSYCMFSKIPVYMQTGPENLSNGCCRGFSKKSSKKTIINFCRNAP